MYFTMCLVLSDVYWYIQMQQMQRLDQWNEYVCMYMCVCVCMYVRTCVCVCVYVHMYV
jgi:hypothetical protein